MAMDDIVRLRKIFSNSFSFLVSLGKENLEDTSAALFRACRDSPVVERLSNTCSIWPESALTNFFWKKLAVEVASLWAPCKCSVLQKIVHSKKMQVDQSSMDKRRRISNPLYY
jgi:hypothetical protein